MTKVKAKWQRLLTMLTLIALAASASGGLYQSFAKPIPGGGTVPLVALADPHIERDGKSESEEGDKSSLALAELSKGHTYPSNSTPPLAVDRALAWVDQHVPSGTPAGSTNHPLADRVDNAIPIRYDEWTSLGPQPLNDGPNGDGRYGFVGGRVNALAADPINSQVVYAGTAGGGVWKTVNCCSSATTWLPLGDNDPAVASSMIGAITIYRSLINGQQVILAGTGDSRMQSSGGYNSVDGLGSRGLLKSTNYGASWITLGANYFGGANGGDPQRITAIVVDEARPQRLLVGTQSTGSLSGLHMSVDGGTNWQRCSINAAPVGTHRQVVTDLVLSGNLIYVALGDTIGEDPDPLASGNPANGVYMAKLPIDNSCPTDWQPVLYQDHPVSPYYWTRIQLAISQQNPATLFAIVGSFYPVPIHDGIQGIYRIDNQGKNVTLIAEESSLYDCHDHREPSSGGYGQTDYNLLIKVDPTNAERIYIGAVDLYETHTAGTRFDNLTSAYNYDNCPEDSGQVHPDQHALTFLGSSSNFLVANDGGVYYTSDNGQNFTQLNNTLGNLQFYAGDITPGFASDQSAYAFGGMQDNAHGYYSAANTNSNPREWATLTQGDGFYAAIEPKQKLRWYAGGGDPTLYCSTTGPSSRDAFQECQGGWEAAGDHARFNTPLVLDHLNCSSATCDHLVYGTYRVWETINGGLHSGDWTAVSPDLTGGGGNYAAIRALAFAPNDTATIFAGTDNGHVQFSFNAGRAAMANWRDITNHITPGNRMPNRQISDIAVSPILPRAGWRTAYVSFDGFNENTPTTPGHLYRVDAELCDITCYEPSYQWTDLSGNLPNIPIYAVAINPTNPNQVFVGTQIGFFYTNDINQTPTTWQRFQTGMPVAPVFHLSIDQGSSAGNTTLVAWTYGRGAYAVRLPQQSWQIVDNPIIAEGSLEGVASASVSDVWAVGYQHSTACNCSHTLTLHWDGTQWKEFASPNPNPNADNSLHAVAMVGGSVWAVGNYVDTSGNVRTLVMRWQGTSWSVVTSPNPSSISNYLYAVTAVSGTDFWAVGSYADTSTFTNDPRSLALHWQGSNWVQVTTPPSAGDLADTLYGVAAASSSDIWAVGYHQHGYGNPPPVMQALHWNGSTWTQSNLADDGVLRGVTMVAGNNAWAVGDDGGGNRQIMHWDGSAWSNTTPAASGPTLFGVAKVSANNVWAVGSSSSLHWDGSNWLDVSVLPSSLITPDLRAITAVTASNLWAVGSGTRSPCNVPHPLTLNSTGGTFGGSLDSPSGIEVPCAAPSVK